MVKKILIGIVGILAAAVVLNMFIPIPINIDKEISAVEISTKDQDYCKSTSIKIKGVLSFYLIGDDSFKGNISLEGYDITQGIGLDNYVFDGKPGGLLAYGHIEEREKFGTFSATTFFDKCIIEVYNISIEDGTTRTGPYEWYVVGPASTREEAIKVLNAVSETSWKDYSIVE